MSMKLFGAASSLLTYSAAELAFSATPNATAPGKAPAHDYFAGVTAAVSEIHQVVIEIATVADLLTVPAQPQTLQELVQAGRGRLEKEQARRDRDAWGLSLAHVSLLEERLRP